MSDIQEEQKRLYKKAEENDKEKWIDISKENKRLLKEIHNREIKELQEEHKNLELSMRINKAIEDLEKTKELNDKHILARDNIIIHLDIDHIEYLLNILKGDNK